MPVHDWTRVETGIFHSFHNSWTNHLLGTLNNGVLPEAYYALSEQNLRFVAPDVIALEISPPDSERPAHGRRRAGRTNGGGENGGGGNGGVAVLPPPRATITEHTEVPTYERLRRTIVLRHVTGHSVVALIEIVSRANKINRVNLDAFVQTALAALKQGIHLAIADLYPPGRHDPDGVHAVLWNELNEGPPAAVSRRKPLRVVSYEAAETVTAYVEPLAAGDILPDMPLFLRPGFYVNVPLEKTYKAAFHDMPLYWRKKLSE